MLKRYTAIYYQKLEGLSIRTVEYLESLSIDTAAVLGRKLASDRGWEFVQVVSGDHPLYVPGTRYIN